MRIFGILFLFISSVGFSQSGAVIACPPFGKRSLDKAYRMSFSPQKIEQTNSAFDQAKVLNPLIVSPEIKSTKTPLLISAKEIIEFDLD